MSRPFWVGLGVTLLGGLAAYAAGCGSSSNNGGGGGNSNGGACCACHSPECNTARTVSAPTGTTVSDCTTYCRTAAAFLANCSTGTTADIVGEGVTCPKDGGTPTGTGGSGGNGAGGSIGAGGSVNVGGSSGAAGSIVVDASAAAKLNAPCTSDADCGGLHCSRSGDNDIGVGAGVPNGMCTLACSRDSADPNNMANPANTNPCPGIGGACILFTSSGTVDKGLCLARCNFASTSATPSCGGRGDQACFLFGTTQQFGGCLPVCESDADCGGTRKCDLGTGGCVDTLPPNKLGAFCMTDADCGSGFCIPDDTTVTNGPGTCTAICRLGSMLGCGYRISLDAGTGPGGVCLLATNAGTETAQDFGICYQLCDSTNDCARRTGDWGCFTSANLTAAIRHGVCAPVTPTDAGASGG